jgi:hypothetical protein
MDLRDIACFLKLTHSGARNYARYLRDEGVIEADYEPNSTSRRVGGIVYRLAIDTERIHIILTNFAQSKPNSVRREKKVPTTDINAKIHILADDVPFTVRVHRSPSQRDPLVAALFGPAPAQRRDMTTMSDASHGVLHLCETGGDKPRR